MTDNTQPEALMQLADAYAEASFDQALHNRTLDDAPEIARSALAAAILRQHARIVELAADSVLEDAARLDWLESNSQTNIERVRYLGATKSIYEVTPYDSVSYDGETLRAAIDAARKQGGAI